MRCPQCGTANPAGVSICKNCDYILDDSFLQEKPDDGPAVGADTGKGRSVVLDDDTQSGPPPRPSRSRPARPAPDAGSKAEDTPEPAPRPAAKPQRRGSRFIANKQDLADGKLIEDHQEERPTEDPNEEWREELRRERESRAAEEQQKAAEAPPKPKLSEEERIVGDLKAMLAKGKGAYKGFERPDQIALAGAAGMFLMCFFPWASIEHQGGLIGLEVGGWLLILLAFAVGGAVFLRKSPHWQARQKPLVLGQSGAAVLAVLFTLSKMLTIGSMRVVVPESDLDIPVQAQAQFGVFLALLSAGVAVFGTWPAFRAQVLKR